MTEENPVRAFGTCARCLSAIRLVDGRWLHTWWDRTDDTSHAAVLAPA